jgi:type IV secretion system protein VirB9
VKDVAIGDSADWEVSVNKEGNRLFLKAVQPGGATNMTVVTSIRTYNFDLEALGQPSADMPYTLVFRYPRPKAEPDDAQYVDVSAITRRLSRYRLSGNRELRPTSISEDGKHTYISWPSSAPIPAIYAVDQSGKEVLVNGMMGTDDVYVVDGAPRLLTFRIDRAVASAERVLPRRSH